MRRLRHGEARRRSSPSKSGEWVGIGDFRHRYFTDARFPHLFSMPPTCTLPKFPRRHLRVTARAITTSALLLAALPVGVVHAQATRTAGYSTHARLIASIDSIRRASPDLVSVSDVATSTGGRRIPLIRLGRGANVDRRPALLLLANSYGPHIVGSEIAVGTTRRLVAAYGRDTAVTRLLDQRTIYIVPRGNPDGAEAFFASPMAERVRVGEPYDDDRDGAVDEDGAEDLNGDGLITMMRIEDPAGEWITDPADPFLMRRANAARGERGRYRLMVEGRDNDKDGRFNEDDAGGTDINRNFPNSFEFFSDAGHFPLSSPEARGIAELFQKHENIAAVYVIGPQDNLNTAWTGRRVPGIGGSPQGTSAGGPFTATLPEDDGWFAEASRRFKRTTGWQRGPTTPEGRGDPLSFAYYHMGRFAFGSRGWWAPDVPADTARGAARVETPDPIADERNVYRWLRTNRPDAIVAWARIQHPDFPGKVVEVGGIAPYATLNPPASEVDSAAAKHTRFVQELAGMLPSVSLRDVQVEAVGNRVWRISADVVNDGYFPSLSAIGSRVRWPRRVRVDLGVGNNQSIASGRSMQLLNPLRGAGGFTRLSWVVVGDAGSTVTLNAASPVSGEATQTITLRATR